MCSGARGKFLFAGDQKVYVRGVSYGTFESSEQHGDYPPPAVVHADFAQMEANRINTVRLYSAPPAWLLDVATEHGLRVMVGLAWEQHIAFLDERRRPAAIERSIRSDVERLAGHPAILCYSIGNEIPSSIVRWHGPSRVERFLERLYRAVKEEDASAPVTYVNYPTTEYLELPFLDLVCFNVFLEEEVRFEAYLARLHNLAGDRPLLITELGLDSRRHGEQAQATSLEWQIRMAFRMGCAGAVVFSWTDEWHRGGSAIDEWGFGLTDRARKPKPALAAVREAFGEVPIARRSDSPRVSVVVCTHNGARTLGDCLAGIAELDYPDYEAIVVDDGSSDGSANIAEAYGARLIRTENRGLSAARNTGLHAATGEIVAYMDDDCRPDPQWLTYLLQALTAGDFAGVGGPNIAPDGDGAVAAAVARAPGGPVHVLLSDREAEHIPGCNMAFWKDRLLDIGGFDPQFRVAGDDVDVCWRLQERGGTLAFSPAAMVWHRARGSVRAFFRQQRGYGRAEALLERKWPEKYNRGGHLTWSGRVYGTGAVRRRRWRVYYGTWGTGLFQSVYERAPGMLASLPLMPEWYLLVVALAALSAVGFLFEPLCFGIAALGVPLAFVLLLVAVAAMVVRAATSAAKGLERTGSPGVKPLVLTTLLHLVQPFARLTGRLGQGLTPWRWRGPLAVQIPRPREICLWNEAWEADDKRLRRLEKRLRAQTIGFRRGGAFDRWDLMVRSGPLGSARVRMAVEEHGAGKQLVRFRVWPRFSRGGAVLALAFGACAGVAVHRGSLLAAAILGGLAVIVVARIAYESAAAAALLHRAIHEESERAAYLSRALHESARARAGEGLEPARLPQ